MLQEVQFLSLRDGLRPAVDPQLAVNTAGMCLDRASGEKQPGGDLGAREAICNQAQHFQLTTAQEFIRP